MVSEEAVLVNTGVASDSKYGSTRTSKSGWFEL